MDIVLMNNSSPVNQVSKSLTTLATVSGYLRDTSSIIEPIFMIDGNVSSWANLNYCYIADFHRYYYVNNIVSIPFYANQEINAITTFHDIIHKVMAMILSKFFPSFGIFYIFLNKFILSEISKKISFKCCL